MIDDQKTNLSALMAHLQDYLERTFTAIAKGRYDDTWFAAAEAALKNLRDATEAVRAAQDEQSGVSSVAVEARASIDPRDQELLDQVFSHYQPTGEQIIACQRIQGAAKDLATVIIANAPSCTDRAHAIQHVREAVMNANAAIALGGRYLG